MLCIVVLVPAVGGVVLPHLGVARSTALATGSSGRGSFPVVLVAGLASDGGGFQPLLRELRANGVVVLDFDVDRPGVQPFTFFPRSRTDSVPTIAVEQLGPQVKEALAREGFDPSTQQIDVVAHSYGGLLARWLVEREGWGPLVDDLVMVATPHRGTEFGFRIATLGSGHEEWDGVGGDIRPGSSTLRQLSRQEPPGETYTTIAGDPVALRWLRIAGAGFDGTVPTSAALLPGATQRILPFTHGRLLRSRRAVSFIRSTLAARGDDEDRR